jgi:hypothetical protein
MLYVAIMGHADPWIFFRFSILIDVRTVPTSVRLVSLQRCAELRFVLMSEVPQRSQVSPNLFSLE